MFQLITLATSTAKFTGSPIPLRTSHLVTARNSQPEGPWYGLKSGKKDKPTGFCLRRPCCSSPVLCSNQQPKSEGREMGTPNLWGALRGLCFPDSTPKFPYQEEFAGRGMDLQSSFLPASPRPNHLRPSF